MSTGAPRKVSSLQETSKAMLLSLEGGQYHAREKISRDGILPYDDFLSIGVALKTCFENSQKHDELIERLKPHAELVIGILPPGILSKSLLPAAEELVDINLKSLQLNEISDAQLRQWIIDDCSLVYGELSNEELRKYFAELNPMLSPGCRFIDLGSGLGKVVMSAALYFPFSSCKGIEIFPYRHSLALESFVNLQKLRDEVLSQTIALVSAQLDEAGQHDSAPDFQIQDLLNLSDRVSFQLGDMFDCDVTEADLVFIYSTCFGSLMPEIAEKLANEAPEGCLVTTTTYQINHPGLELVTRFPAKSVAWTDLNVYRRVGSGPWPKFPRTPPQRINFAEWILDWEAKARELLAG